MKTEYWHHWNGGGLNDGIAVCLGTVVCLVAGLWLVVFCHHGNVVAEISRITYGFFQHGL